MLLSKSLTDFGGIFSDSEAQTPRLFILECLLKARNNALINDICIVNELADDDRALHGMHLDRVILVLKKNFQKWQ